MFFLVYSSYKLSLKYCCTPLKQPDEFTNIMAGCLWSKWHSISHISVSGHNFIFYVTTPIWWTNLWTFWEKKKSKKVPHCWKLSRVYSVQKLGGFMPILSAMYHFFHARCSDFRAQWAQTCSFGTRRAFLEAWMQDAKWYFETNPNKENVS